MSRSLSVNLPPRPSSTSTVRPWPRSSQQRMASRMRLRSSAGFVRFQSGFGSVPKPLWNRTNPADERNRIRLAMRCWLLRGHGHTVLVDDGLGGKFTDKLRDIYRVEPEPSLEHSLAAVGVK